MPSEFDLAGAIVPWGRSAAEYEALFDLADVPESARVLDCGGGPASFCAEWTRRGRPVVAVDPLYARTAREIEAGFADTAARMLVGMRRAYDRFRWTEHESPEAVVARRRAALDAFLRDIEGGGPYVAAKLPTLPFADHAFDLVLSSHLLFLYSDEIDLPTHLAWLREMLRVGGEVRVFPLRDMSGNESTRLKGCVEALESTARVEIVPVPHEFRFGDTSMLRLTRHG